MKAKFPLIEGLGLEVYGVLECDPNSREVVSAIQLEHKLAEGHRNRMKTECGDLGDLTDEAHKFHGEHCNVADHHPGCVYY